MIFGKELKHFIGRQLFAQGGEIPYIRKHHRHVLDRAADTGEIIIAFYVPMNEQISDIMIKEAIKDKLASFKIPKLWLVVDEIPRNLQGKINYQQLNFFLNQINNKITNN